MTSEYQCKEIKIFFISFHRRIEMYFMLYTIKIFEQILVFYRRPIIQVITRAGW